MKNIIVIVSFVLSSLNCYPQKAGSEMSIGTYKRILFLGNSITYSGEYIRDIEAYILLENPGFKAEIINLGLPSETVSGLSEEGHADGKFPRPDLHERLERILKAVKPDLVFACYGMNDGIYLPLDSMGFRKFKDGINWLHAEVVNAGAKIVHLTPPIFDERRGKAPGYENVLAVYSSWLMKQQAEQNWQVIDLHTPMWNFLQQKIKVDTSFALAEDGVHPGEKGHWLMAQPVLSYLGFKQSISYNSIHEAYTSKRKAPEIIRLIQQRQLTNRDSWLSETKHLRPGLSAGLSIQQSKDSVQRINHALLKLQK